MPNAGTKISAMREKLGMTQEELAHAIGVTVSTLNRWENGHIAPSRLARNALDHLAKGKHLPAIDWPPNDRIKHK